MIYYDIAIIEDGNMKTIDIDKDFESIKIRAEEYKKNNPKTQVHIYRWNNECCKCEPDPLFAGLEIT